MIKWVFILIGLIVALSLTEVTFVQPKAKAADEVKTAEPENPAEPAQTAEETKPAKSEASRVVAFRAGGIVTAVDVAGRKITIDQDKVKQERKLTLAVSKQAAKHLAGIKVGDVVNVWVKGRTVTTLRKVF
jgi:Cu/Ag efflux protein CusF